jgi:Fur family ferric uptake transcriptional regulator
LQYAIMNNSRKTKKVQLVLDLFNTTDNALSVVELISIFSDKMNKTTVYRILDRLEDSGILHSFLDKEGLKRYAKGNQGATTSNSPIVHPHFICQDCGVSSCLPLEVTTPSIPNYTINNSEHLYIGKCNEC